MASELAEALTEAWQDPELQMWFRQQQSFHRSVRGALGSVPVPPELRQWILSERAAVVPLWQRPELLLMAACLALLLMLAPLWFSRTAEDASWSGFQSRMVGFASREYRMDIATTNPQQLRQYLQGHGAPADYELIPGLQRSSVLGGGRLSWQNHPVGMVCFAGGKGEMLFLFVIEQSAIGGGQLRESAPEIEPVRDLVTAGWRRHGKVYLLAAPNRAAIEKIVRWN
jgi:hypothetical protein